MRSSVSLIKSSKILWLVFAFTCITPVWGADLTNKETASGLKEALTRGADVAVEQLGKPNGFLGDKRVRIPLPESARAAVATFRALGGGWQPRELEAVTPAAVGESA